MSSLDSQYPRHVFLWLANRSNIERRTVSVYLTGRAVGMTHGEIYFRGGYVLRVFEHLDFLAERIRNYSYELLLNGQQVWWYDPVPHPNIPELQSTNPHHKHIPPDIKHHRVPAPNLAFTEPNLPQLIADVETLIAQSPDD